MGIPSVVRRVVGKVRSIGWKGHLHLDIRRTIIASHLEQAGSNSIVIVGDSRVESARLPSEINGKNVVNAGVGGATVGLIETVVLPLIDQVHCIVFSVGVNNAKSQPIGEDFELILRRSILVASKKSERLVLTTIPPVKNGGPLGVGYYDPCVIWRLNQKIADIAQDTGLALIDLASSMSGDDGNLLPEHSRDGVHLTAEGYSVWTPAIKAGIANA